MKRPTRKFISFSTALVSMLGLIAPVSAAKYESELTEKCEYDELFEMRDKAILIKDGNDYTVNDNTSIVIIDSDGKKQLISMEEGLSGIYSYVTTTRGEYNFISPSQDPYSFDFFDENYRISTEAGSIIAGFGDKYALMDKSGKKLSAEYDAIYRISDDYFMVDLINGEKRSTGLIKADGSVIAAPAEGIGEFYLCGDKFLVSNYKTEVVEEEDSWTGETVKEEKAIYSYHFMDSNGKSETETFKDFEEIGHDDEGPNDGAYLNGSDSGHNRRSERYRVNYAFECDCILLTDNDGKKLIYNSKTGFFSDKYDEIENINSEKFIVSHDGVYDVIDSEFKIAIQNPELIDLDSWYYTENGRITALKVKKDGKVTIYDTDLNVIKESDVIKRFPTFNSASIEQNGNIITVNSDENAKLYDKYEELVSVSVDVEVKPVWENSDIEVSIYNSNFDFGLEVLEEYYDEAIGYSVTTSNRYKYLLDSNYGVHDVSEYASTALNVNHDIVILKKEDNHLKYVNFKDEKDNKDLGQYVSISSVENYDRSNNNSANREKIGYCLKTEDSFVISNLNFEPISELVKGEPSEIKINSNGNKYSGSVKFYVKSETDDEYEDIIVDDDGFLVTKEDKITGIMSLENGVVVPADEYDKLIIGDGGYLVVKDDKTTIVGENGETLKDFEGVYNFNFITGCPYDLNWNLVKRVDGVTTNIVYNVEDKEIKYQQTGIYDEVSNFVDGYATVTKYAESNTSDNLWQNNKRNSHGIIRIDATEVIKPSDNVSISMTYDVKSGISYNIRAYSSTNKKSYFILSPEELDTGYIETHNNMTVAKIINDDRYIALVDGLWGVYDGAGKSIIEPQFDYFSWFNENGLSIVETPEYNTYYYNKEKYTKYKTGVIDINGNIIVKPFNNITKDEMNINNIKYSIYPNESKTVLLDKYGVQVCKLINGRWKYTTITREDVVNDFAKTNGYDIARKEGDLYYVEKDGLAGIVSEDNEILVPIEYAEVLSFNPSEINFRFVRPELQDILQDEFSSKINEMSDDSKLAYVKTLDNKVGVYKLSESKEPVVPTTTDPVTTNPAAATTITTNPTTEATTAAAIPTTEATTVTTNPTTQATTAAASSTTESTTVTTYPTTPATTPTTAATIVTTYPTTAAATTTQYASVEDYCTWSVNDYYEKTGIEPADTQTIENKDGTISIILTDNSGTVLDTYVIDPVTGKGSNSVGENIDLPQTGNNSLKTVAVASSALVLTIIGVFAAAKSGVIRRKED